MMKRSGDKQLSEKNVTEHIRKVRTSLHYHCLNYFLSLRIEWILNCHFKSPPYFRSTTVPNHQAPSPLKLQIHHSSRYVITTRKQCHKSCTHRRKNHMKTESFICKYGLAVLYWPHCGKSWKSCANNKCIYLSGLK